MPLAFESLSHDTIAFGFFNIESDMLLLDRYFIFANDFCRYIEKIADNAGGQPYHALWPIDVIESAEDIGDLMGAIQGVRFSGFIGELYHSFPFPRQQKNFKQNPEGFQTQSLVSGIISKYARRSEISVTMPCGRKEIAIGDYRFSRFQFQKLLQYIWQGGYPQWKEGVRPAYVTGMKDTILQSRAGIFDGIVFDSF